MPRKISAAMNSLAQRGARRATLSVERGDLCVYLADFASEFDRLAKGHDDLRFLSYLLGLVLEEAVRQSSIAMDAGPPPGTAGERDDKIE
jgi:hypothetical protein